LVAVLDEDDLGGGAGEDNTTGDLNTAIGNRDERLSKTS